VTKKSFDHRQLLGEPTGKLTLDGASSHLDATGINRSIFRVAVAFTSKLEVCSFNDARMASKAWLGFNKQILPPDMMQDSCKSLFQQFHIGWRT
jgi:hypothetical protein